MTADDGEPTPNPSAPGRAPAGERLAPGTRIERFIDWRRRLTDELIVLPDTLRQAREGVANFELASQRLVETSESLEEITSLYRSTLAESTRRSAEAAEALRSQLESLVGQSPERVASTLTELQRTFESLAQLNPFWVAAKRKPSRD